MLLIASLLLLISCGADKSTSTSILEGSWYMKEEIFDGDGSDITKGFWDAHDALRYEFMSDGKLIVSDGPEPLEPTEWHYTVNGDSTLHIYHSWQGNSIEEHYTMQKIGNDTIKVKLNAFYIKYPDSISEISSGGISFLERDTLNLK